MLNVEKRNKKKRQDTAHVKKDKTQLTSAVSLRAGDGRSVTPSLTTNKKRHRTDKQHTNTASSAAREKIINDVRLIALSNEFGLSPDPF